MIAVIVIGIAALAANVAGFFVSQRLTRLERRVQYLESVRR